MQNTGPVWFRRTISPIRVRLGKGFTAGRAQRAPDVSLPRFSRDSQYPFPSLPLFARRTHCSEQRKTLTASLSPLSNRALARRSCDQEVRGTDPTKTAIAASSCREESQTRFETNSYCNN